MIKYPEIDPVAISLGPVAIHWYGLMYLVGFVAAWLLLKYRARKPGSGWTAEELGDLVFYCAIGVIIGGRLGYLFFYNFDHFLSDPLSLLRIWEGGMSFHGGFLGVAAMIGLFAWKTDRTFFQVADVVAPVSAIGLGAGRIGNFINGELWGRTTDVPWGMVFPGGGPEPRHPSQLYQFLLEGVVLFLAVWFFSRKPRPAMAVSGLFLLVYGVGRFIVEFFRQPDSHLNFVAFEWMTRGQQLSIPMILIGAGMVWWAYRRGAAGKPATAK